MHRGHFEELEEKGGARSGWLLRIFEGWRMVKSGMSGMRWRKGKTVGI